jgi:hypothetical protein
MVLNSVIPALRRITSLGYKARPCLKKGGKGGEERREEEEEEEEEVSFFLQNYQSLPSSSIILETHISCGKFLSYSFGYVFRYVIFKEQHSNLSLNYVNSITLPFYAFSLIYF